MAYTPPGETRRKVYTFMRDRLLSGHTPTLREVQQALGFRSVESARMQLEALVRDGLLHKRAGESRGYRLSAQGSGSRAKPARSRLVPLIGRVQAGTLTTALEEPEGYLPLPTGSATASAAADDLFALRVRGESMIGAGLLPDDLLIVRRQRTAATGDIVVALVEGLEAEATVKTLRRRGGRVTLEPANPNFAPIEPAPGTLTILGKVIEVRRYLEGEPLLLPHV